MTQTVVMITGANRGIGRGVLELYLARPNHQVIAVVRKTTTETLAQFGKLPKGKDTKLVVVEIDATVATDPARAAEELLEKHQITHVDILVANAGIALKWVKVSEVTPDDLQQHVDVNVYGFVLLYQAFLPLLQKSKGPKWVTIGSSSAYLTVSLLVSVSQGYLC